MVLLYLASTRYAAGLVTGGLEARYQPIPLADVEVAHAVVVLGGIFGPWPAPGYVPNISETAERLDAGISLIKLGRAGTWCLQAGVCLGSRQRESKAIDRSSTRKNGMSLPNRFW